MAAGDPRAAALDILRRVEKEGAYSSLLLQHLDDSGLDTRDIALVTELVYGVLRRQMYLDHVIAAFSSRPIDQIELHVRLNLRLALYQLLCLTRIPPHAAVNEAARLARRGSPRRAEGTAAFVNGLLRSVLREPARVPAPPVAREGEDPVPALAIAGSHPEWLTRRWVARFGAAGTARLLETHNRPAPVAMRVTRRAGSRESAASGLERESVRTRPSFWLDDFLIALDGVVHRTQVFRRGELYLQDEATGMVARLAAAAEGDRVLDACAAPGGKALCLAETVGPDGLVVAGDLHPGRLRLVRDNARRLDLPWCVALAADFAGSRPPFVEGTGFDVVMVDAPCSGTGVIRRNPELRYRLSPGSLRQLASLQRRLLSRCASLVRPGGALVYSVCSLEPEEGPDQVRAFLRSSSGFAAADPRGCLPPPARGLAEATADGVFVVTLPHRDELDGFFAARLVRQR